MSTENVSFTSVKKLHILLEWMLYATAMNYLDNNKKYNNIILSR